MISAGGRKLLQPGGEVVGILPYTGGSATAGTLLSLTGGGHKLQEGVQTVYYQPGGASCSRGVARLLATWPLRGTVWLLGVICRSAGMWTVRQLKVDALPYLGQRDAA